MTVTECADCEGEGNYILALHSGEEECHPCPTCTSTHMLPPSQIVWWCAQCEVYTLEHEGFCPTFDCDTPSGRLSRQKKRRGYICADCEELYLSQKDFMGHAEVTDA